MLAVKPLSVRLQTERRPLSANTTYEIGCEVVGAKPKPTIEWTKGGVPLKNVRETVRIIMIVVFIIVADGGDP